ncbi:OmpA family protein [Paracoccus sediminis]|uniref:OmpA family protein n=1 Tax=Paracoccus sediminis TaxID=1214787 RepID=A0A238XIJ1_9RHOB|nr:OmpA family protein [Paracoccus sediminis]TBN48528.1 OmpA family protein [Paracoccus sediminis]SNR58522.1 Outer membrane protein OmpA [Paracoccus sediminis]
MTLRVTSLLAVGGLVALGACAPADGTGMSGMSRTQQGALAGAAVGAVLGATRDDDSNNEGRDAARGAILGAAAGAVAGNILDRQAQALQQSLSNPNIQVINRGSYLQVIMPEGILFATDSAAVSGAAQNDLYAVARNLNQYPNSRVEVVGHTDSTGSAAYNADLSQRRAQSVAGILAAAGVSSGRLIASGAGYSQPVASNDTAAGRAQNRRVEILIRPNS